MNVVMKFISLNTRSTSAFDHDKNKMVNINEASSKNLFSPNVPTKL